MQNILTSAQVLYQALSLRGKLILAFVILALIPMTAIEYYADSVARDLINKSTQQNLVKTSNQTALQIDLYISSQMNSIRTEAQVPFLSNYLKLAPTERTGSIQEINAKQILVIFSRKDPAFIKSYALLDQRGVNLLDTNGNQVGDQEGGFDYFKKTFANGLPFASSVLFQNGNVFYISAAVRNENGVIIGVLRAKYDAAIIQSMVLDILPIQGNSDFLSVIDKNTYVRLADTGGAENLYKSLKSFSAVEILDLQSRNLLPVGKPNAVISASDKFVSGFDRLSQEPFFTTYSDSIQTDALMTGTPLTTVPWVVIEGRSQAALSQPVSEQRRTALMLAFLILTVAVFAALWVSQIIAKPVVNLISIAQRVSAGDLEASAPVLSNDEVGTLARAFNTMTEKLRQTLAGLHDELKERKHAEGILLQFRRVMDESSDAIYFIDPEDGRYIDFNKSAYEWLGYTREELTQISIVDVAQHITNLPSWHERVEMVHEKGVLIFETNYRRKDGSVFPVEVSARMLDYENTKILLGIVRDGTERKRSENALRESEEKFRKMFHSSPIAICISTLDDGRVIDANYAYWDLTGLDPQIAIGKNLVELNIWSDLHERDEFVAKLKRKRSYYDSDSNFIDHNGNMKSTLAFYEIIEIGGQERILSMFYDMSAQKATMQALQQSEVRTRALLEAMPDMIMEISLDGLIVNIVPPKGTESAMPPENFIGRQIYEVLSEKAAFQTLLAVERALETNHIHTFEFAAVMGHQTQVMEARVVASVSDTAIVIIRDITQSKWVETEREKLIRDLEVANRESETLRESLAGIVTTYDLSEVFNRSTA